MSKYRNESNINEIIIHCAVTPNGKHFDIHDIDRWHHERNFRRGAAFVSPNEIKLQHVGYHFVIELDGDIKEGRKLDETGAHAKGHNNISIGICMIGMDKFTDEQWIALGALVDSLISRFPEVKVIGHNEISNKTCPGFNVQSWLANHMQPQPEQVL